MKLDGEQVRYCRTVDDSKPNTNPFGYSKTATGPKSGNAIVNEDQHGAFYNLKAREENADQLQYLVNDEDGWNASKLDSCMRVDNSRHDNDGKVRDFEATVLLPQSSLKSESFDKDSVFYIDKNVMEPQLPELVVCYKENNTYHVVKDICIDEGVPSHNKFLFETGADEMKLSTFFMPEKDINCEMVKDVADLYKGNPFLDENEFSLKSDSKESSTPGGVEDGAMEDAANHKGKEVFSLGELLSIPDEGVEVSKSKSFLDNMKEASAIQEPSERTIVATAAACEQPQISREQASSMTSTLDYIADEPILEEATFQTLTLDRTDGHSQTVSTSPGPDSATEQSDQGAKEDKSPSVIPVLPSESTGRTGDELSCNSIIEAKRTSSSSAATTSGGDEASQSCRSEHLESPNTSKLEYTTTEPFSGQLQYSQGESSFSAAGPISGLISYSGPIAYSGSQSLRSDSSTTSTRSFAFPILQSEWNSSPVRMAKADRRHYRKHRGWRQGLICCGF